MKREYAPISTLIADLVGGDDGPPEKENAAPAGNRDGANAYGMGDAKNSTRSCREVQELIGERPKKFDSPLDVVVKITRFPDVQGFEKKTLALSMRDLADEIEHWSASEKARLPLIVGGEFGDERSSKGSLRHADNRRNVTCVITDYDDETISFAEARRRVKEAGVACLLYTSPSHTEDAPRWRAVFPLSRPHPTSDLERLTDRANGLFDGALAGESWSPVQPFYAGQVRGRAPMRCKPVDGRALDRATDLPAVPSKHGSTTRHRDKAEDPREKRGEVGAWCSTYTVPDVIDEFLSRVYAPAGRNRYRFKAGSSPVGGVGIYDDGRFAYSNHDSDPARGLNNAFDLVRIHRFGDLDAGLSADTPMGERPSYVAMIEFARRDPAVAAELAHEESDLIDEFEDLGPEEESTPSSDDFLFADQWSVGRADRYIVKGMIGAGDVGALFGPPGSGKSVVAPFLAHQIARGERAFGLRTRESKVLYVSGEDGLGIVGRFLGLGRQENIGITTRLTNLNPGSPDLAKLSKMVAKYKPGIVFVDTLAACFPGLEENSAEGMGKVLIAARALTKHGAAVCFIHHSTKDSNGTPRGHSILNGALDFSLEMLPKDDSGIIRAVMRKNRNGPLDAIDIGFRIGSEEMGTDADGDAITVPVCRPLDGPAPAKGPKPTAPEKAALDVLRRLDNGALGVDEAEWRRACQQDPALCASDDPESRRKAVYRAIQGLARKRLVTMRDGRVWAASRHSTTAEDFDEIDELV